LRDALAELVATALREAVDAGDRTLASVPDPALERPRDPSHGDWATTVALRSAKEAGIPPRQIAEALASHLAEHADIAAVEIAGPGFVNIRLAPSALQRVLTEARRQAGAKHILI
jgi:arginyl-tRNA synthetase